MKTTKIDFKLKILLTFSALSLIFVLLFSCDVLEPDADILHPSVNMTEEEVFVLYNNSAFIDLNSKIKTTQPVSLSITSTTKFGTLTDLGQGLLQYTPAAGKKNVRDGFEFTVRGANQDILKIDTITISVQKDSTNFPCGIYPADDYVYGVQKNYPLNIPVLANDYICSADSADLMISVYRPDNTFPPYHGKVEVVGQTLLYTASGTFEGSDKLIYKVYHKSDPVRASYGMVYLYDEPACDIFYLSNDSFEISADSLDHPVYLPALQNDSLCYMPDKYEIHVAESPEYGEVNVTENGFTYRLSPLSVVTPSFTDSFLYEVCKDANCKTARVELKVRRDSVGCTFTAATDSIDLSKNNITPIYLDVLYNDSVCDGYSQFTITQAPPNGIASISDNKILYQRDTLVRKNDSLEYQICSAQICSRAKVYIKRAP
jgi:hypothetical protein